MSVKLKKIAELLTEKCMHNGIFRAYVYSSILSIYYADIANMRTYHDTCIYCASAEPFMWGLLRLAPIMVMYCMLLTSTSHLGG